MAGRTLISYVFHSSHMHMLQKCSKSNITLKLIQQSRCRWKTNAIITEYSSEYPRVCIVGSGPAGFYTAQQLLKSNSSVHVDIFEKLPVPYGLVRFGVAPDHPEVKNVINTFQLVANDQRCRFLGNVDIGHDVTTKELRCMYDAVVLAYGADNDRMLGVPGEYLVGVHSARSFVGWYNGLPAHSNLSPDLSCDTAVIVGQGNVALDVARILLAPMELLKYTDICEHSLKALNNSNIQKVYVVGRRGPLEVSFTIKELREIVRLENCQPIFKREDFEDIFVKLKELQRPKKRLMDLMCQAALNEPDEEEAQRRKDATHEWQPLFLRSPVEVLSDADGKKVEGIKLEINKLVKNPDGSSKAVGTEKYEEIKCGLIFRSIGYKSMQVEKGIPFDRKLGIIPNINGRVIESAESKEIVEGLYCSGWVKHGPVGVILTTMTEAKQTALRILEDIQEGAVKLKSADNKNRIMSLLQSRGVKPVSFYDWQKIDEEEIRRGQENKKPREKILSEMEMLKIAFKNNKD